MDNYSIHILTIKLWEWEAILENANVQILRHGPEPTICGAFETAQKKIPELKVAIEILKGKEEDK